MACTAEYRKKYYYANREKVLRHAKTYRENNKEKIRAANAKYREAKRIEREYAEWDDTLRELGYADLINA